MDPRLKVLWRKSKKLRIGLALAGLLSLGLFLILNFSLKDSQGPFAWQDQPYRLNVPLSRNELTDLNIQAENVRLEVAMVNNIKDIQVSLSGPAYDQQDVAVDIRDKVCDIVFASSPGDNPENLSLRVLIPQNDLIRVGVEGEGLDLHLARIRADQVNVASPSGHILLEEINSHRLFVMTKTAKSAINRSFVTHLTYQGGAGDLSLRENTFRKVQAKTTTGPIFVFGDTWRGQWDLISEVGDITGITRRLPYNLLIQAHSPGGQTEVGYDTRYWKDARPQKDGTSYFGGVGNNPSHSLTLLTGGHILVDQRGRDTDIDPYA